jgi:hypothetical protein
VLEYGVRIVRDDDLPGHNWMFVTTDRGPVVVLTRSAAQSPRALAEAWAAWRTIATAPQLIPVGPRRLHAVS